VVPCPLIFLSTALAGLPIEEDRWLPLQIDGVPITDEADDTFPIAAIDLVGDGTYPAAFWSIDEDEVFFRIRLAGSPLDLTSVSEFSCFPLQCAWGTLIDDDTDLTAYERLLAIPDGADAIQVWGGSGTPGADATPDTVLHSEDDPWPGDQLVVTDADSTLGDADNAFLDIAVPRTWLGLSSDEAVIRAIPVTGLGPISTGMDGDRPDVLDEFPLVESWPDPVGMDGDGDGLRLDDEWEFGTDPQDPDTDDDGLNDKDEQLYGTDPLDVDTDADGLTDGDEVHEWGTSPVDADTDGDGLSDGDELTVYDTDPFDPVDPDPSVDIDCDGLSDEIDPDTTLDPDADADADGLSNAEELACGTDVCVPETDHDLDGIETETEISLGFDACDPLSPDTDTDDDCDGIPDWSDDEVLPASDDIDGDGILNDDEAACGGDPCVAEEDTDADGLTNAEERTLGTDPCDPSSPDQDLDEDCDGVADYLDDRVEFVPDGDNDGDQITNAHELDVCGTDPCLPTPDPDADGVPNETEALCQTDPCNPDTDADGRWDSAELQDGDCGPDSDGDGLHDAIDPDGPITPDPLIPDDSENGLSGGSFTGGGCNQSGPGTSLALALMAGLLVVARRRYGTLAVALLMPSIGHADSVNAQNFRSTQIQRTFLTLPDAVLSSPGWTASVVLTQAKDPLIYRIDSADRTDIRLLGQLWSTELAGGHVFDRFAIGFSAPVHAYASGQDTTRWGAMGDLSAMGQYTLLDRRASPVGIGFTTRLTIPTGDATLWLRQETTSATASVHASAGSSVVTAVELGFEGMGTADLAGTSVGSRTHWGLALHAQLTNTAWTSVELSGTNHIDDIRAPGANPAEALFVGRLALSENLIASLGAGTALSRGIGSPAFRTVAGLSFSPVRASIERRPEPSSTPPTAEPPAGPPHTEGLLHISASDSRGEPIEANLWLESTDTRVTTNDDGVALLSLSAGEHTIRISAPGHASLRRMMTIEAGTERDLLVSLSASRANITDDQIIIDDKVFFETGSASILAKSHGLLDEVALLILDHPDLGRIEVQGHTDSVGQENDNLTLSSDRATAVVNYLINAGVSSQRLDAVGKGEAVPLVDEDTEEARATNRRVEFHVQGPSSR